MEFNGQNSDLIPVAFSNSEIAMFPSVISNIVFLKMVSLID